MNASEAKKTRLKAERRERIATAILAGLAANKFPETEITATRKAIIWADSLIVQLELDEAK